MNALRKVLHVQEDMTVSERTALLRGVVLVEPAVISQCSACSVRKGVCQLNKHIALRHAVCTAFKHYAHGMNALRKVLHVQEDMTVSERTALLRGVVIIEPAVVGQSPACSARQSIRQLDEHIALRCTPRLGSVLDYYIHGVNALREVLYIQFHLCQAVGELHDFACRMILIEPIAASITGLSIQGQTQRQP